jgi:glutaredoxin
MKTLKIFYLDGCPYCRNAAAAVKELRTELPGFETLAIEWIEERKNAAVADRYDYYNVPSVFFGDEKLYECKPGEDFTSIKHRLRRAIETAIEA